MPLTKSLLNAIPSFSLICNGQVFDDCWKSISIQMSMTDLCNTISVGTLDFFEEKPELWNIKKGDKYIAIVNNEIVSTGWIDNIDKSYSGDDSNIVFSGRDLLSDLVDCTYEYTPNEWYKQTLENLIRNLCRPFGIEIYVDPLVKGETSKIVNIYKTDKGEKVADQIAKICFDYGILPLSLGDGKLTLTKSTLTDISSDIIDHTNVLSADMTDDDTDRYSDYICKTEGSIGNRIIVDSDGEFIVNSKAKINAKTFKDPNIKRYRPYTILSDQATSADMLYKRAKYEANIRAAKSRSISYVIEGWTEINSNKVWKPNRLVVVNDSKLKVNEPMLIDSVSLDFDSDSGYTTSLDLARKECYSLSETAVKLAKSGFDT